MSVAAGCNCRAEIDKKLAPYNTRLQQVFTLDGGRVGMPFVVATSQVESGRGKKKAASLFASFCPFCGVSVESKEAAP